MGLSIKDRHGLCGMLCGSCNKICILLFLPKISNPLLVEIWTIEKIMAKVHFFLYKSTILYILLDLKTSIDREE